MAYRNMWEIEVKHEELNKYRHIRGYDKDVVAQKANAQLMVWDEMWGKRKIAEQKKHDKEAIVRSKEDKKQFAITKTNEAQNSISHLESILVHALSIDSIIDWSSLLNEQQFPESKPAKKNKSVYQMNLI